MVFGAKKQVLLVGNDGTQLYIVQGKRVSLYADFSESGGSLSSDLRQAFKTNKNMPLVLLFDVAEQQYRKEGIPKVNFMDKNKVIQRKLMMAFPQQQMRAFMALKQKPKDDEALVALFAGLSPTLSITQVMDAVIGSEVNVQSAHLLPLESTVLVQNLVEAAHKRGGSRDDTRWSILMTKHKTGGLRQVVIKDGDLALTRLTPFVADPHNKAAVADEMMREFNATLTYLARFGYIPSDGLDLVVVGSDDLCQSFRDTRLPVTHLYALTLYEAGQLAGLNIAMAGDAGGFAEALHAGFIGAQRKLVMPLSAPLLDKVRQGRQFARLAILIAIAGAGYMGWESFNLFTNNISLQNEIHDGETRRAALQNEHDELAKKLNTLKYEPEKVKAILGIQEGYLKNNLDIEPMLAGILSMISRETMLIKEISFAQPGTANPDEVVAADPTDPMADKPKIVINFEIGFAPNVPIDQAARLTTDLAEKLRVRFPGREVSIKNIVGNLAVDQTVQGISEQVAQGKVEGRLVQEQTSKIQIKGAVE